MSAIKLVEQLRQLSAEESNRPAIIRDNGSVSALLLFLDHQDKLVVKTSLESLEYLSLCVPLRPELSREFGLKVSLEKLTMATDSSIAEISSRVLNNLNGGVLPSKKPPQQTSNKSALAASLTGFSSVRTLSATEPTKVLFASQALKQNNKTVILRSECPSPKTRSLIEDALLSVRGVVSFTFDAETSRFTVRAKREVEVEMLFDAILDSDDTIDICQVVKGADGKETFVHPWRGDSEGEDDEYEDEENRNPQQLQTKSGKSSGKANKAATEGEDDDGYFDEYEDEEVKKKSAVTLQGHDFDKDDKRAAGWFGGIGSYITKSIWG